MYIKSFNGNLQGYGGFQFVVGEIYEEHGTDGFHFAKHTKNTIVHSTNNSWRFCEIEPLDKINRWGNIYACSKIKIVRELTLEEVYQMLLDEGCDIMHLIRINAPFDVLKEGMLRKNHRKQSSYIKGASYLSAEQKTYLLSLKHVVAPKREEP